MAISMDVLYIRPLDFWHLFHGKCSGDIQHCNPFQVHELCSDTCYLRVSIVMVSYSTGIPCVCMRLPCPCDLAWMFLVKGSWVGETFRAGHGQGWHCSRYVSAKVSGNNLNTWQIFQTTGPASKVENHPFCFGRITTICHAWKQIETISDFPVPRILFNHRTVWSVPRSHDSWAALATTGLRSAALWAGVDYSTSWWDGIACLPVE